jgi:hypothetical protein
MNTHTHTHTYTYTYPYTGTCTYYLSGMTLTCEEEDTCMSYEEEDHIISQACSRYTKP